MTDLKKLNYSVFLAIGIGSFVFGIVALYILATDPGGGINWLHGVLSAPILIVIGLHLIYKMQKEGHDIAIVPSRKR